MRKLFEQVTERLRAFLAQRDDLALVVQSPPAQSVALLQLMDSLEEQTTWAMFWKFAEPFTNPWAYVDAVVESFATKHEVVRLTLEQEGKKPWPPLPAAVKDANAPASRRLRELMIFARSLLPALEGAALVWVVFPGEIEDRSAYAQLMSEVLQHEFPFPWCHHIRFLLRDEPADRPLFKALGQSPRVAWYAPDLSAPALEKALQDEAADETLPMDQRVQALLMTAATDYSHKRYDQALDKYQRLLPYFSHTKNQPMLALVLNSLGEVLQAKGQMPEAVKCFEAALVPASEGDPPPLPVLLNVTMNLANVRMVEKRYDEAEAYYNIVQTLATASRSPELKIKAIEDIGQAQYLQNKVPVALKTWNVGATLAEKLQQPTLRKSILERARAHYVKAGDRSGQQEVDKQLAATVAQAKP
jgi:tetratricopeptide (TPR) repeat protein